MRETVVVAIALLLIGLVFLSPAYIRPDSVGVYSYLRSAVFDHDLLFLNEWNTFGMIRNGFPLFKEITPLGTLANHWWLGAALASAPFYLAAAPFDHSGGFFGIEGWTLAWSAVFFTFVTLMVGWRIDAGWRAGTTSAGWRAGATSAGWRAGATSAGWRAGTTCGAAFAVLFGTPLFWYTFRFPLGTHAAGAMFVALAVWAALRDRPFTTGLMAGLAIATRLQHFVLLPAFMVLAFRRRTPIRGWAGAAAGVLLGFLPQAVAWTVIYGTPLGPLVSGAALGGTTWMPFRTFAFGAVLVSSYHGLFVWAPVTLLALAGWIEHRRDDAAILFLLMFAGEWIANASFDRYWWGGMSFGPRRWVDLALPFAVGIAWFARTKIRQALVAAATLWTIALTAGALSGTLPLARYVGYSALLPRLAPFDLHSFVTDPSVDFAIALAIVLGIGALLLAGRRWAVPATMAAVLVMSLALAMMTGTTRTRASRELARFHIDPVLERIGPLLDERRLLADEADYLRATGENERARQTEAEIAEINRVVRVTSARSAARSASGAQPR